MNDKPTIPSPSHLHHASLNRIGVIVLLLGIASAGIVYWIGQDRSASRTKGNGTSSVDGDWKDGTIPSEDSKIASRQIELYYGKAGLVMVKVLNVLKRPESLAIIIAASSALIAFGCFFVAHRLSTDAVPHT